MCINNQIDFSKDLKMGQKEESGNIEKQQKELNLKVIANLETKFQVRSCLLTKIMNLEKYASITELSHLKALGIDQQAKYENIREHQQLILKASENLKTEIQVRKCSLHTKNRI